MVNIPMADVISNSVVRISQRHFSEEYNVASVVCVCVCVRADLLHYLSLSLS